MFPNGLGVYFHDTPSSDLLAKPGRHFTNACVRLEDAHAWDAGSSEKRCRLKAPSLSS